MSVMDEIKIERGNILETSHKQHILEFLKRELTTNEVAIIYGAAHYADPKWSFTEHVCEAPYKYHAAISDWLNGLGFHTCRQYNLGGVDQGIEVSI